MLKNYTSDLQWLSCDLKSSFKKYKKTTAHKENRVNCMNEKIVNVNCSFCGNEIECPENMLGSEKHSCYECFRDMGEKIPANEREKIHVDIPMEKMDELMPQMLTSGLVEEAFPELWKESKKEFKEMPKKETQLYTIPIT